MKIGVKVLPRNEVLDSEGRAVEKTLKGHGFSDLASLRVGKFIEVEVKENNKEAALAKVKAMADFVLYNPLTETYQMEVL